MSQLRSSSQPPPIDELFTLERPRRHLDPTVDDAPPGAAPPGAAPPNPPRPAVSHLQVLPWPDPVIDRLGLDPRSPYIERFWLGIVGPASVLLMRHVAVCFDAHPEGFELDLTHTAQVLGLGTGLGRWGPIQRTVHRCVSFGFARRWGDDRLLCRRHLPPATRQQLSRLPEDRQAEHDRWRAELLRARPSR